MPPRRLHIPGQAAPTPPSEDGDIISEPTSPAAANSPEVAAEDPPDVEMADGTEGGAESVGNQADKPGGEDVDEEEENDNEAAAAPSDPNLIASLPVYLSTSLPASSSLHVFQYPTYPRDQRLPMPESALTAGLRPAMRWRPKANRVEVELPIDDRPSLYNADRGAEYGRGANAGGTIGAGGKKKVKKEEGQGSASQASRIEKLRKTRLESSEVPHTTTYMVAVIRDGALHLTPLESIIQLRPSMHYLDELRRLEKEKNRQAARDAGADLADLSGADGSGSDSGAPSRRPAQQEKKKAQTLNVSVKQSGEGVRGGAAAGADRDSLMAAQHAAEGEDWVDCEWFDEESPESERVFKSQLFSSEKTVLKTTTRPRDFLPRMT